MGNFSHALSNSMEAFGSGCYDYHNLYSYVKSVLQPQDTYGCVSIFFLKFPIFFCNLPLSYSFQIVL